MIDVDDSGNTTADSGALDAQLETLPPGTLSTAEEACLIFIREEEKLAQDVYALLVAVETQKGKLHPNSIFTRMYPVREKEFQLSSHPSPLVGILYPGEIGPGFL